MRQEAKSSFHLQTKEPNAFWKVGWMWWIIPKSRLLRKWESRGNTFFVTMWNGDTYQIQRGTYEAKYYKDQYNRRVLQIKPSNRDKKLGIYEMPGMFPKGREDFDALIEEVGATKSWVNNLLPIIKGIDKLR